MKELHDITECLLDVDGSCRDLNFEGAKWEGVEEFLSALEQSFMKWSGRKSLRDQEVQTIDGSLGRSVTASAPEGSYYQLLFEGGSGMLNQLQVFIYLEEDGSPFVELTFFPQDVKQTESLKRDFLSWVEEMQTHLQANRCYCRYENASWQFGDTSPTSGVFMVSDDFAKND